MFLLHKPDNHYFPINILIPEEIAQLVMRLIENPNLGKLIGDTARKRVEEVFNWDKSAIKAIESYERIVNLYHQTTN